MPIRNDVIFGPGPDGQRTFGHVRMLDQSAQIQALKRRLDAYLVDQISELGWHDGDKSKVNSPFPLFLLTLVAMETLGKALFQPNKPTSELKTQKHAGDDSAQKDGFLEVAKRVDKRLSAPLNADEKEEYNLLWETNEHKKISSTAEILYRFGRHTMAHGYRGKGVYISADDEIGIWRMNGGAIELNPYKFWVEYRKAYDNSWIELSNEKEPTSPRTRSAIQFLNELLYH
jgi:hypothetical protein